MTRKVILDCDPGHDDATNILMAGIHPNFDVLGITTVKGNQTIEKTTKNALNVCQWLGLDIPVYEGMTEPMVIPGPPTEERVHGQSGLDGPSFPELKKQKEAKPAVQFLIDTLMAAKDHEITLIPTGPMTNIAMAMRLEPRIVSKIKEIVMMGGSYENGNVTPSAEFNIYADAEAAYVVFNSGIHITMMGLDVTRKALCDPSIVDRMEKVNNKASKLFVDMMRFFIKAQHKTYGWEGAPLHDPCTTAYLIDPSIFKLKDCHTDIEIRSEQSYGRTNCDIFNLTDKPKNTSVAMDINTEKFWNTVEECLKMYD